MGMSDSVLWFVGWIPGIIFPGATLLQLIKILRSRSVEGVSLGAWCLFGTANVCMYIYSQDYRDLQTIFAFLGTAVLNFAIVVAALVYAKKDGAEGA